jgi:hypothetical protein
MADPKAGFNADFHLDNSAGTLTDITTHIRTLDLARPRASVETQTLGDADTEHIALLKSSTFSITGDWNSTIDAILDAAYNAAPGTTRSFQFDPEGAGSGLLRFTGECICTQYDYGASVDGVVPFSATLVVTGAVTRATQ